MPDIQITTPAGTTIDALAPSATGTITGIAEADLVESVVEGWLTPAPPNSGGESPVWSPDTDMDTTNLGWRVDFDPVTPGNVYTLQISARVVYNDAGVPRTIYPSKSKSVTATLP